MPKNKERIKFAGMKLQEARERIKMALKEIYEEGEASAVARLVMDHLTRGEAKDRLAKNERELSAEEISWLDNSIHRLQQHEPVQYVTGTCWFYHLELFVDHNVLIPRPETEEVVDWIISDIRSSGLDVFKRRENEADETAMLKILDIGTGSGCIALALKEAMPKAEVWGCDVSEEALNVARRNGARLDIRVDFQGVDFLDEGQQRQLPSVDIMVSNPPYIPLSGKAAMQQNVVGYEPHLALFVPDEDPLLFYKAMVVFAGRRLHESGTIYLEMHEDLAGAVAELFRSEGFGQVQLKKDMQGKDRMLRARRQVI